jgi:hypothetical protein
MKYYTVDKFAIVILPAGMSEKAKTSKSLFNSFNRIYRFATIGGVSLAAWFSSQFIQQNNRIAISNARANSGQLTMDAPPESAFTASSPEMMMKSAPVKESAEPTHSIESIESAPAESAPAYEPAPESSVQDLPTTETANQYAPEPSMMPSDGDMMAYVTPQSPMTGEPISDLYLSIIIALAVGVIGLIIERILSARRKKTRNYAA